MTMGLMHMYSLNFKLMHSVMFYGWLNYTRLSLIQANLLSESGLVKECTMLSCHLHNYTKEVC